MTTYEAKRVELLNRLLAEVERACSIHDGATAVSFSTAYQALLGPASTDQLDAIEDNVQSIARTLDDIHRDMNTRRK